MSEIIIKKIMTAIKTFSFSILFNRSMQNELIEKPSDNNNANPVADLLIGLTG